MIMKLYMKQKVFSFKDKFTIKDNGSEVVALADVLAIDAVMDAQAAAN